MAIKKSTYTGTTGRLMLHSPYEAQVPAEAIISHTFTEAVAAADILELAYLPPFCRLLSVDMVTVGTGAVTATVGLMSGEVGSTDPARTSGNEIFNAVTPTTEQRAALAALVAVEPAGVARSIGVRFSGNVAANAATKLHFRIRYATGR